MWAALPAAASVAAWAPAWAIEVQQVPGLGLWRLTQGGAAPASRQGLIPAVASPARTCAAWSVSWPHLPRTCAAPLPRRPQEYNSEAAFAAAVLLSFLALFTLVVSADFVLVGAGRVFMAKVVSGSAPP